MRVKIDNSLSTRLQYATDASSYREIPIGVAFPKDNEEVKELIAYASLHNALIFRTAGTSLAGQCVGNGIVVDLSNLNKILEFNEAERWVRVQPGVILQELNNYLLKFGLQFGPETSTSNRCMIGGMAGNNACGLHSLVYGSTRDHVLSINAILSDGSEVLFSSITSEELKLKVLGNTLESNIYKVINAVLSDKVNQNEIRNEFPLKSIKRRNTGYALDLLLETELFSDETTSFNLCKLLVGSEGTLAFFSEITLNLIPLPPKEKALVCVHLKSIEEALQANLIALMFKPEAIELMDKTLLDLTKENTTQRENRFFIQGDPGAILMVEFAKETIEEVNLIIKKMELAMLADNYGFHFAIVRGNDINRVWNLRKAGLGLLSLMKGNAKPVTVIEDVAVEVGLLPEFIHNFNLVLESYSLKAVAHAHIGTGELHMRPVLDLHLAGDRVKYRKVATDIAYLVKKYRSSLSGEHGDGRVRSEFVKHMVGDHNYRLLEQIKEVFDPKNILNPGKIVNPVAMDECLRYQATENAPKIETFMSFNESGGYFSAVERCNGSADCRKTSISGGTMCPSYMATREERHSTRARANVLRELLNSSTAKNKFNNKAIYEVLALCLSCKACKTECPSNIDMAKLKAEFLFQYYKKNASGLRSWLFANINDINKMARPFAGLYNFMVTNSITSKLIKYSVGIANERNFPALEKFTLSKWLSNRKNRLPEGRVRSQVYLFIDEFTNYNDVTTGIKAVKLLTKLGYEVLVLPVVESGRAAISKGFLDKAKKFAEINVKRYIGKVSESIPLIGIEPSAILSFRDEYPSLVDPGLRSKASILASNTYLIDEFLANEMERGVISSDLFRSDSKTIYLHGHCHQKALASIEPTRKILSKPTNYKVIVIPSGCCGMAGSFGYEKEHYEVSMAVGELVLFPAIRNVLEDSIVSAPGFSCREQIMQGTGRTALHPVAVLYDALK